MCIKMIWQFLMPQKKPARTDKKGSSRLEVPAPTQLTKTGLRDATLVITHAEVCDRHGTGALLGKIFQREPALLVLYSRSYFESQSLGTLAFHPPHPELELEAAERKVAALLDGHNVKRILCVPGYAQRKTKGDILIESN